MSVDSGRPVQQRRGLVEQCEIGLAPRAALRQPPYERLGRDARERFPDDAVEVAAGAERALHVLERAVRAAAELLSVEPVDATHELVPEPLARGGERVRPVDRLLDELCELLRV